jgi:DNA-binding CsgD family transcriptional regulator/tetratricopeptide (TPR) repeat protein
MMMYSARHSEQLRRPYEEFVSEAFETRGHRPLLVISGPPGVDLDSAFDEVFAYCNRSYPTEPKIVNFSFGEPRAQFNLADHRPPRTASRAMPGTVLLVKDLHRVQPESLASLENLIRRLRGTTTICVCGIALPIPPNIRSAFAAIFDRLRQDDLVHHVNLRPSAPRTLGTFVAGAIEAVLEPAALTGLWQLTRGWPAAAATALDGYLNSGMARMVDRRAYLRTGLPLRRPDIERSVLWIRRMGTEIWHAAKAAAILSPLGEATLRLTAEALGVTEAEALMLLAKLDQAGVLKYRRADSTWRFRLPLVAACITELLGPYERRRLAQIAVSALWNGTAHCADPRYLPDRLADAGAMIDQERARNELLLSAGCVALRGDDRVIPWLRAAAEFTRDRAERAGILFTHARTSLAHGEAALALESSEAVLRGHISEIPGGDLVKVLAVHLAALNGAGDTGTLEKIAQGDWWPWPGSPRERAATRAFALSLLGRWREARDVLDSGPQDEDNILGEAIGAVADLWLGKPDRFGDVVDALPGRFRAGENPVQEVKHYGGALLVLAERDRAERLLESVNANPAHLGLPGQSIAAVYRGDIDEALALAHKSIASSAPHGCDHAQTAMYQLAAVLQLFRGRLARARELIAMARDRHPTLPHLLAIAEARYELILGEVERARSILETALFQAGEAGVLARTEGLWIFLADIALRTGQTEHLPEYLRKVEHVADRMGTELAEIDRLTLRALVEADQGAAQAAIRLARRREQPLEQVVVLQRLVRYGAADPALLAEAYALLADMNALLSRASMRTQMRNHGVAIPGRQETVAENERLLAVLVAEGLSNKQIATALEASEKSVEGRLSRLFSRAGYQSRVALATAMLTGQFH